MQTRVDLVTEGRLNSRVLKTITGKWSVEIIVLLYMARSMGFEELRKHLTGISSRTLSLRLKELEEHGFVKRTVKSERPPRVHYSLTEKGRAVATLSGPLIYYIRSQQHLLFPRGSPAPAR
ncbi:MAG: helix-turn-helix transcriptional regulator [Euryarchaeota archaeon]|nr:helix-turn-helix transcriptional regulator [Euryarchaeota archaeon]